MQHCVDDEIYQNLLVIKATNDAQVRNEQESSNDIVISGTSHPLVNVNYYFSKAFEMSVFFRTARLLTLKPKIDEFLQQQMGYGTEPY